MLDAFDLKILAAWQRQGDMGPAEMSQVVNLSASQCSRRMQQLRKNGFVEGVFAALNPEKLRVSVAAYVLITMKTHNPENTKDFYCRINSLDEVVECQTLTGTADVILKVVTHNLESFNDLLTTKLLAAPEVATAHSSIILENIKSTSVITLDYANKS